MTDAAETLSIVVPVYDEEQNLATLTRKLLDTLQDLGRDFEIIFINDGSTDGSADLLDELAAGDARIRVVHFKRNFGQTSAMMAGLDYASGDIIIPIDADLQNDPADIPRLLERLDEGFDLVSGWRKDRKDDALSRNLPSWIANRIISRISGVRLHDYGCTLKAYRRSIVEDIRLYGEMHRFLPVYASWSGARTTELPVKHHARKAGRSKYGLKRVVKVPLDLLVVKFLGDYSQKPIYVFGGFGMLNHALALLTFVVMLYFKFWGGKSFIETPLPTLAALFILMGFMSMLLGLIAELVVRTYHESQDKPTYIVGRTVNLDDGGD
ncbi:MAG: glycosyltransferase family 2 protein [Woeseiaceae bacterium]|nr:glycosyltransferase family 2 protein [Woeseiaceae bacterium]